MSRFWSYPLSHTVNCKDTVRKLDRAVLKGDDGKLRDLNLLGRQMLLNLRLQSRLNDARAYLLCAVLDDGIHLSALGKHSLSSSSCRISYYSGYRHTAFTCTSAAGSCAHARARGERIPHLHYCIQFAHFAMLEAIVDGISKRPPGRILARF